MFRNNLLSLLAKYNSKDLAQIKARDEIIEFVKQNERCFERTLESGHITGSAFLLNRQGDKALLMNHRKLGLWLQLGGHCDGDPDILSVAIKEAQEESGINGIVPVSEEIFDLDVHFIPANSKERAHYHYDIRFLLQVNSDEEIKPNWESKELRWVSKDLSNLPTDSRSVVRMFEKWLSASY